MGERRSAGFAHHITSPEQTTREGAIVQLDWGNMFKRYVGNSTKTPYFVAVDKLTRVQANNEIFVFVLFQSVLLLLFTITSLSDRMPHAGHAVVPFVTLVLLGATVAYGASKAYVAAAAAALAPIAAALYCAAYGFHPNLGSGDKAVLIAGLLIWARYCWRILGIARRYDDMAPGGPDVRR